MRNKARSVSVFAVLLALVLPFFAAGCGPRTPEAAVSSFFNAIQDQNWNAYLDSILPDDVRSMSQTEQATTKEDFGKTVTTFKDLKYKTEVNDKDKNKATVSVVSGRISAKDPSTGQSQTTTVDEIKKTYGKAPTYQTEKFKGRWYVDLEMESLEPQTESQ
jgi:hypothetical protein